MHENLFKFGHSRLEVRQALLQHQKRDHTKMIVLDSILAVCALFLVRNLQFWDACAAYVGLSAFVFGLRYFVDMSARNFYLHRLDWEDEGQLSGGRVEAVRDQASPDA
jgi:hypothetical protein